MITTARARFIEDFNAALRDFLASVDSKAQRFPQMKLPLIVLTLSDSAERSPTFLNKMFNQVVT